MAKVLLAMSGGVDSSVAAYILAQEGHLVTGASMNLLDQKVVTPHQKSCCSALDINDARQVAEKLGFNFYVFNFQRLFFREVIERFAKAYVLGLTPNPCLDCNRYLKFHHFWDRAQVLGNEYVSTGHYARIEYDRDLRRYVLKKAFDETKDQSYVLYAMSQPELARTLLPLGNFPKTKIRQMALNLGLINAQKPDSQDICFVRQGHYTDFLAQIITLPPPGDIVDLNGKKLGTHPGIHFYTVGQRRGLNIPQGVPYYVLKINPQNNTLIVGPAELLEQKRALIINTNFITQDRLEKPLEITVKIRYRQKDIPAEISPHPQGAVLTFQTPQKGVSPGQAAVFYCQDMVVGGGTISGTGF
jgi:tRNA-specific 2-thiouridylase